MRIIASRRLRGPNRYLSRPVLVARIGLDDLADRETVAFAGFADRLLAAMPGLAEHHCAQGRPGGFAERLHQGTYFGHVVEHVAIELSQRIGRDVNFGRTESTATPGEYDVVTECPLDEPAASTVPEKLLATAIGLVGDVLAGRAPEPGADLVAVRETFERERPGPGTAAVAAAARARGIPVERVGALSLLRLGHGERRRLVWAAVTDATGAVGVDIAADKQLTRQLLDEAGIPVPPGGTAARLADALALFTELGPPVVVKPRAGRQGRHVYLGVDTPDGVRAAFDAAVADGGEVVVERQLHGRDYRVLVVDGAVVAAAERIPAHVTGDGRSTVAELVEAANRDPRRGVGHGRALTRLAVDEVAATLLCRQGCPPTSVPAEGRTVWLRDNANLSTGGTGLDVTDDVHPDVADLCRRTAALVGLDIAGIDLRLPDIAAPLPPPGSGAAAASDPGGGVIEVNASPGLRMHLEPAAGQPRDVAAAIVTALFPKGNGRIPTVAVTGTNGKTSTARLVAHLLAGAGRRVGLTTTDGVYLLDAGGGGRLVRRADASGPRSAQAVLGDPTVQAAVLETARGGLVRAGLGYDRTDVGVVTNLAHDHLGQDGIETMDDLVDEKALVAERVRDGGTLVLGAECPWVRGLVQRPRVRAARKRVVWFSAVPDHPVVRAHMCNGGRAYVLADGWLVEADGDRWRPLLAVEDLPGTFGGAARYAALNALAAVAAADALGVPTATIVAGLRGFRPAEANPGRGMLFARDGVHLLVDYAHNPAAIAAVGDLLHRVRGAGRTVAVVTLPGDRRDDLLAESARVVAEHFDRVVLYEDTDLRGRAPGEVPALIRRTIEAHRPDTGCTVTGVLADAVDAALARASAGDVILLLYEKIDPVLDLLARLGAEPATDRALETVAFSHIGMLGRMPVTT